MAISIRPEEKYAFLFTGDVGERYENDVIKVFNTLTEFYGYPTNHIWVVSGGGSFPNADFTGSNELLASTEAKLKDALEAFTKAARTVDLTDPDRPAGTLNNAFLYFTGKGGRETVGSFDTSFLVINGVEPIDVTAIKIKGSWLKTALQIDEEQTAIAGSDVTDNDLLANCQIDVYFEQSYGGGFYDDLPTALNLLLSPNWSFTSACSNGETSSGGPTGSTFTDAWTNGLKLVPLSSGANSGKYADELIADTEDTTNLKVSLRKAWTYAKDVTTNSGNYQEKPLVDGIKYLGLPAFLIRDGNHGVLTDYAHESPDIYLTHPTAFDGMITNPDDEYVQDTGGSYNNIINVETRNIGTHPVRKFAVGVIRFQTGGGGSGEKRSKTEELIGTPEKLILCPVLLDDPVQVDIPPTQVRSCVTTFDDIEFPNETHRCVRAKADLLEVTDTDLDDWSWTIRYEEAQRNIDYSGVTNVDGGTPPPGEAGIPEDQEDIPDNGDDTEANEKMKKNLQGFKEHIYEIRNPFHEKNRFILVFPEVLLKYREQIATEWFELTNELDKKMIPLEIIKKPYEHIQFILEPKESKKILFYLAMKPKEYIKEIISLPFEILVDLKQQEVDFTDIKKTTYAKFQSEFALFSGFTVKIKTDASKLFGIVQDKEGNPVANTMICIQTVNTRQGAIIRTSRKGTYAFSEINPDVYRVMAVTENWHTKEKLVYLPGGERGMKGVKLDFYEKESIQGQPVRIILDRIRILNDHDPCLKGKGELVFTSFVSVDDNKPQVVRLPQEGVYKVSDKAGKNTIDLGVTIFEGAATKSLEIKIAGRELDKYDPDDDLNRYSRVFGGDMKKWYGKYYPGDEYHDKEDVGDWQVWYRIVRF